VRKYWLAVRGSGRWLGSSALVALLICRIDWHQVGSAFAGLDVRLWLGALLLYLLTQAVSAWRWQVLGRVIGLQGSWGRYFAFYFIGMFFNLVLPTSVGGDVVRAWYLARQPGPVPPFGKRTAAFLSVLADRVNGLAVLIVVACVATLVCPLSLPLWMTATVAGTGAATLAGVGVLPLLPWLAALGPVQRASPRLRNILEAASLYWSTRGPMLLVTFLSLLVQLGNVVLAWLVGEGLGLPVPPLYYGILVPLVSLLTLLPISLNGMGLREAGTVLLLAPLGISPASAVTLSLLIFAVYTAASLGGGFVYLFGQFPRFQTALANGDNGPASIPIRGVEECGDAQPVRGNSDQGRMRQPPAAA
jgi:uncharacterized membrane protein YbhN (UPF0104 family)